MPSICYLNRLPDEMLGNIIEYFIASTVIDGRADTIVPLRVCRKWREVAQRMHCINILRFSIETETYNICRNEDYLMDTLAALRQFIQRCNLIQGGLVGLSLDIQGAGSSIIGMIGDAVERLPTIRTYSEEDGAYGIMLRILPRLREEQYAHLTYLGLLTTEALGGGFDKRQGFATP